jgi:glycosyltransferase involved in cell wall biosynthesis
MKTHIVIPIGVSQPGTPVLDLLEKSIDSIQRQTSSNYVLTVAADSNVSDDCKKLLSEKGVNVKWFEPASFFRRGGIWKKISETWKSTDTKYLAFLHYDDMWHSQKLEIQVKEMEANKLAYSWSETYVIDKNTNVVSGDCSFVEKFDTTNIHVKTLGLAHAMIVNREDFFSSGILEFEDKWSPVWENLFILHMQRSGNGKKAPGSKFFWRNHDMNMTNSIFVDPLLKPVMDEQHIIGNYSRDEIDIDHEFMNRHMNSLINEISLKYRNER